MSSNSTKSTAAHDDAPTREAGSPFAMFAQSELFLWPYRSLARTLLHTHHNTAALLQINRKLADETREIIRRQQNFVLDFSEKLLNQMSERSVGAKSASVLPPEAVDKYFESAIANVREFGQALTDAQVHSIEAFQERAHEAVKANVKSAGHAEAAE